MITLSPITTFLSYCTLVFGYDFARLFSPPAQVVALLPSKTPAAAKRKAPEQLLVIHDADMPCFLMKLIKFLSRISVSIS